MTHSLGPCKLTFHRLLPSKLPVRFCQKVTLKETRRQEKDILLFLDVFINITQAGVVRPSSGSLLQTPASFSTTEPNSQCPLRSASQPGSAVSSEVGACILWGSCPKPPDSSNPNLFPFFS